MGYSDKELNALDKSRFSFLAECQRLQEQLSCDVTAVSLQDYPELDIKWPYVWGNRNEKYKYLTVRYGKGLAGKVIATGAPLAIAVFPEDISGKATDYPIMLAEQLVSAYAVPLIWQGNPKGALLVGYRHPDNWKKSDDHTITKAAGKMESLLPLYFTH